MADSVGGRWEYLVGRSWVSYIEILYLELYPIIPDGPNQKYPVFWFRIRAIWHTAFPQG